ncbi:PAS domain-containing protein [Nannocystis pusilla]|uniref:PAS domain-containing protein n=1 Tax=Nannocystis pusilla TaxID=889268 RepID=A0A9X3IVE9_9BACT|nr:PAS domain-containing protein [Nannocystis pusilla]MCY1004825.1 PAS domain-containing protein [Nannocystis pusilla]
MATESQRAALDRMTRALHLSGAAVLEFEDLGADDPLAADAPAYYSDRVCRLLGRDGDVPPVVGTWLAAVHPDDRDKLRVVRREQLLTAGAATFEYRVQVGGATRWWQEQSEATSTRPGRASLVAVVRDITDERAEQEEVRRSVELLRQTQAAGAVGGWEVDLVNNTLYWTEETHRLHEVPPGFVPDLATAIDFYAPEHVPIISAAVERCMQGEPYDVQLEIVTFLGNRRHVQAAGVPFFEDGKLTRLYGIFRDITEQRRREDELQAQIEIIARQDSAIRQLSTPIIQLWDDILTLPLLGTIDAARAAHIMERLLGEVTRTRALRHPRPHRRRGPRRDHRRPPAPPRPRRRPAGRPRRPVRPPARRRRRPHLVRRRARGRRHLPQPARGPAALPAGRPGPPPGSGAFGHVVAAMTPRTCPDGHVSRASRITAPA